MRRIALILMVLTGVFPARGGIAEDWQRLDDTGVLNTLNGAVVDYEGAWQEFKPSKRTVYNAGQDSWGYWDVRNGRYCSQWPPADGWACYDVLRDGQSVRFIGDSGAATDGVLRAN